MALMAPVPFKVAAPYGKILQPDAHILHGKRILSLADAYPLFGNESFYKASQVELQGVRPVATSTIGGMVRAPLKETIRKDNEGSFLVYSVGGIKLRLQIADELLTAPNLMKSGQLFIVQNGVTARKDGPNVYSYVLDKENDMRMVNIPAIGWTTTDMHPALFGTGIEPLKVYLNFPRDERVLIGSLLAGNYVPGGNCDPKEITLADWSELHQGVLIYSDLQKVLSLLPNAEAALDRISSSVDKALLQPLEELIRAIKGVSS